MGKKVFSTGGIPDATVILSRGDAVAETALAQLEEQKTPREEKFDERFQTVCPFASGGVGVISKAKDRVFDRVVALKGLNAQYQDDPSAIRYFLKESRLNAQLDHPSIAPVYSMGRNAAGKWECAMKFINGTSLSRYIQTVREDYDSKKITASGESLALASRLEYFLKVCEAVEYSHSMKVVHGDIKPDNILIGKFGEVYLMDWGCARELGVTLDRVSGTPNFLPPEFLVNKVVTKQIDVFSLGMILFELVTLRPGKQECSGEKSFDCTCGFVWDRNNHLHYSPKIKVNDRIFAIAEKALAPDPADRYATVEDLAADIRHYLFDEEVSALPDNPVRKIFRVIYRNRMKSLAVAVSVVLFLLSGLFYSYYTMTVKDRKNTADLMRRLKMQSYTDILASAVEKNFLAAQSELLLFADDLLDSGDNEISQRDLDRIREKVLRYRFGRSSTSNEQVFLLRGKKGVLLASPGGREENLCLDHTGMPDTILWTSPARSGDDTHLLCRYPLRSGACAAIRWPLDSLLSPLLRANAADPVHKLFVLTENGLLISIAGGRSSLSEPTPEIRNIIRDLKENNMQQIVTNFQGVPHYAAAAKLSGPGGMLIQMIAVEDMNRHNHVLSL